MVLDPGFRQESSFKIQYGLVARIPGSHPGGSGSIPGLGTERYVLFRNAIVSILFVYLRIFPVLQKKLEISKDNPNLMLVRVGCGSSSGVGPGRVKGNRRRGSFRTCHLVVFGRVKISISKKIALLEKIKASVSMISRNVPGKNGHI